MASRGPRAGRAVAGERNIALCAADVTQQFLKAGLLDEIHVSVGPGGSFLAPVRRGVVGSPEPVTLAADALAGWSRSCIAVGANQIQVRVRQADLAASGARRQ